MKKTWRALDLTEASQSLRDRFWSKVEIAGPDECWEWKAHKMASGYGQFGLSKGVFHTASRVSLALVMPLAAGQVACHRCDNPPCVNPAHLFAGSQVENARDSVAKGRANRVKGESHPSHVLTEEDVRHLRSLDFSRYGEMTRVAGEYGIAPANLKKAVNGITWRHVTDEERVS